MAGILELSWRLAQMLRCESKTLWSGLISRGRGKYEPCRRWTWRVRCRTWDRGRWASWRPASACFRSPASWTTPLSLYLLTYLFTRCDIILPQEAAPVVDRAVCLWWHWVDDPATSRSPVLLNKLDRTSAFIASSLGWCEHTYDDNLLTYLVSVASVVKDTMSEK